MTQNDLKNFQLLVGEAIMYFQTIEHDIRIIYAAMKVGDLYKELERIESEKWTLGQTIVELEKLDLSDGKAYISNSDYKFLKTLTWKRNNIVHKTYQNFLYEGNVDIQDEKFRKEYKDLQEYTQKMRQVYKTIEETRLKALKDFRNI
ncbi:MAG: hypothetical protein K5765_01530 [Clostridia bacterium]|nr:hypothetical protein [Clostridia bacterium]